MKKITIIFHADITLHISTCKKTFCQRPRYYIVQSQNNKIKKTHASGWVEWQLRDTKEYIFFFKEGILP